MNKSFLSIAFNLRYGSPQIECVYSLLDLFDKPDTLIEVSFLKTFIHLPQDFREYLSNLPKETINILFEKRKLPTNVKHEDWDLIDF